MLLATSYVVCVEKNSVRFIPGKDKKIHSGITGNGKTSISIT
jgi:hypothetical protein